MQIICFLKRDTHWVSLRESTVLYVNTKLCSLIQAIIVPAFYFVAEAINNNALSFILASKIIYVFWILTVIRGCGIDAGK